MQPDEVIYMDVGPCTVQNQLSIKTDDDKIEYAELKQQTVQCHIQRTEHTIETAGEVIAWILSNTDMHTNDYYNNIIS